MGSSVNTIWNLDDTFNTQGKDTYSNENETCFWLCLGVWEDIAAYFCDGNIYCRDMVQLVDSHLQIANSWCLRKNSLCFPMPLISII